MSENICKNCVFYDAYYVVGHTGFEQLNFGQCLQLDKQMYDDFKCPAFIQTQMDRDNRMKTILDKLADHLDALTKLKQFLDSRKSLK